MNTHTILKILDQFLVDLYPEKKGRIMKGRFQDLTCPDISTPPASTNTIDQELPKTDVDDLELGLAASSSNGDIRKKRFIDATLVRMVLAEAIGTFFLMFCIGGIIANLHFMGVKAGLLEYSVTAGLTVVVIVFSLGSICGAHVNPAVTIAFATVGPFPWSRVPFYILAQVGGSVLATYMARLVYGIGPELMVTRPLRGSEAAFGVEFIATFIILFLTSSLLTEPKCAGQLSGFVAGMAICLGVLISGPVSGGSMNPARSLGPALVAWRFDHLWIYIVAPTTGAISGVVVYRIVRLQGWSCKSNPPQRRIQVSSWQ